MDGRIILSDLIFLFLLFSFLLSAASIISNILPLPAKVEPALRLSLSSKAVSPSPVALSLALSLT